MFAHPVVGWRGCGARTVTLHVTYSTLPYTALGFGAQGAQNAEAPSDLRVAARDSSFARARFGTAVAEVVRVDDRRVLLVAAVIVDPERYPNCVAPDKKSVATGWPSWTLRGGLRRSP